MSNELGTVVERKFGEEVSVTLSGHDCALVMSEDGTHKLLCPTYDDDALVSSEGALFKLAVMNMLLSNDELFYQIAMMVLPKEECESEGNCEGCPGGGKCHETPQ